MAVTIDWGEAGEPEAVSWAREYRRQRRADKRARKKHDREYLEEALDSFIATYTMMSPETKSFIRGQYQRCLDSISSR